MQRERRVALERAPHGRHPSGGCRAGLASWLLLSSFSPRDQSDLLDAVELGLDAAEARAQPLGIDLSLEDLQSEMKRLQPRVLPSLNAAVQLSAWPWALRERSEVVVPSSALQLERAAVSPWGDDGASAGGLVRAMRFAAWPLAYGLLIATDGAASVERVRAELGAVITATASPLALLIDRRAQDMDKELVDWERLAELQRRAARVADRLDRARLSWSHPLEAQFFEGLRAGLPRPPALPWFEIREGELFVVPKLGALARQAELLRMVRGAARRADVTVTLVGG